MRAILISAALAGVGTSCMVETPTEEPTAPLDCQKGYYELNGQCVLRPDVVTIELKPVTTNAGGVAPCPLYSPSPASVKVQQNFRIRNTTASTYTILIRRNVQGSQASPLTTVAAGETSSAFSISDAGERQLITAPNCSLLGVLYVTAG